MSVMPISKITPETDEIPPLENGDSLDQETFHERYEAMPEGVRAELIGGVVYMASPVGRVHSKEHSRLIAWAASYEVGTQGVEALSTPTIILGDDSEVQPDVALCLLNGKTKIVVRGEKKTEYIAGPPELVVETTYSTSSIDLHGKRKDYEKYGVAEYLCFLVRSRNVVWFVRKNEKFVDLKPDSDGILRSRIFPGLWLDPVALLAGNLKRMMEVLNQGIASPEHTAFAASLRASV